MMETPQWHDRPTCAGNWLRVKDGESEYFETRLLQSWTDRDGHYFGPIPPLKWRHDCPNSANPSVEETCEGRPDWQEPFRWSCDDCGACGGRGASSPKRGPSLPSVSSEQVEWEVLHVENDNDERFIGIHHRPFDRNFGWFVRFKGSYSDVSGFEPSLEEAKSAAISAAKGLKEKGNV